MIERLGADPLLVSMFVEAGTQGHDYLAMTDMASGMLPPKLAGFLADYPEHMRSILEEDTNNFIEKLEYLAPSQARQRLKEAKTSVSLVLLYLARQKNTMMAKYVVERLGGDPASVAAVAQAGGEEEAASFLRDLDSP